MSIGFSTEIKPVKGKAEKAAHIKGTRTYQNTKRDKCRQKQNGQLNWSSALKLENMNTYVIILWIIFV